MSKLKQHWPIILLVVVILGGLFYWYELRPSYIRKYCSEQAKIGSVIEKNTKTGEYDIKTGVLSNINETKYKDCIRIEGLEK